MCGWCAGVSIRMSACACKRAHALLNTLVYVMVRCAAMRHASHLPFQSRAYTLTTVHCVLDLLMVVLLMVMSSVTRARPSLR